MHTFEVNRYIEAPRADAWAVLSDLDGWARHAPNLSKTEVIAGTTEGAVRECHNKAGKSWRETCTLWQPGRRYVMEVDTSSYPYPMTLMRGTFSADESGHGARVSLHFDYQFKYGLLGRMVGVLTRPMFNRMCMRMLDGIEAEAVARAHDRVVHPAA
jgi:ribosome-associated toxin RatA of RatAB toxin-antitoxin module